MLNQVCSILNIIGGVMQVSGAVIAFHKVKQKVILNPEKQVYTTTKDPNDPNSKSLSERLEEWINESLNKKIIAGWIGYLLIIHGLGICIIASIVSLFIK